MRHCGQLANVLEYWAGTTKQCSTWAAAEAQTQPECWHTGTAQRRLGPDNVTFVAKL